MGKATEEKYEEKKPLDLRVEEAQLANECEAEHPLVDIPGGQVEIRELSIENLGKLQKFQKGDDGEVDGLRAAIAIAMFMCYNPDTGKPAWKNTPKRIAWFLGLPMSVMRPGGWLHAIDSEAGKVMVKAIDPETAKKNSANIQSDNSPSD